MAIAALLAARAGACGVCAYAMAERGCPVVVPWSYIGFGWFAATAFLLRGPAGSGRGGCFNPFIALIILVGGALFATEAGPLPFLVVGVLAFAGTLQTAFSGNSGVAGHSIRARWLLGLALASLGVTWLVWSPRIAALDDAEYIVRWPGTPPARALMSRMEKTKDLASLRRVLASSQDSPSGLAAEALGRLGERSVDAPLILGAMERLGPGGFTSFHQHALEVLLGGKPADVDSVASWRRMMASGS